MDWAAAGLGLQRGTLRLVCAEATWTDIADDIAKTLRFTLGGVAAAVEHVGSTAVPGFLAKPILDFAIGMRAGVAFQDIAEPMSDLGWIYRGDAGADGGLIFVLEDAPGRRVAHAHGVEHRGEQWNRYLQFRDVLRRSEAARGAYEHTKQLLAAQFPSGREQYTAGKTGTVLQLLRTEP